MYHFKSLKTRKEMSDIRLYFSFLSLDFKVQAMDNGTKQPGGNILRTKTIIQRDEIFCKIVKSSSLLSR